MIKFVTHVLVFAVGAGAGIWWGVNHPNDASRIANVEQTRVQQAEQTATSTVKQISGQK